MKSPEKKKRKSSTQVKYVTGIFTFGDVKIDMKIFCEPLQSLGSNLSLRFCLCVVSQVLPPKYKQIGGLTTLNCPRCVYVCMVYGDSDQNEVLIEDK